MFDENKNTTEERVNVEDCLPQKQKSVQWTPIICAFVSIVIAAAMLASSITSIVYEKRIADMMLNAPTTQPGDPDETAEMSELELLGKLFEIYSFSELDEEQIKIAVLRAYVSATGDEYARYYTDEEYETFRNSIEGDNKGIGINIIESSVTVDGKKYDALKIVNVISNTPAEKAELKRNDYIVAVGTLDDNETVSYLGYDGARAALAGDVGTNAEFLVYRYNGTDYELIEFSVTRDEFTTEYVTSTTVVDPDTSEKIGVVLITQFYFDTPTQVSQRVDALVADGCTKIVFDLRDNPGGLLSSIVATLSYFLDEGDPIISVKDKQGNTEVIKVAPISMYTGAEASCNVSTEDIGKYKHLDMAVLCNGNTASAAELFVANFRDHEIGTVVGTTTFGKGSVQSYIPLYRFGYTGVLKMTVKMYYPPCGEGYDGIGIEPDVTEKLSDEAEKRNKYDIFGDLSVDNQLAEAIKHFK